MPPFPDKIHHWVFHSYVEVLWPECALQGKRLSRYYCKKCASLGIMGTDGHMEVKNHYFGSGKSCDDILIEKILNE